MGNASHSVFFLNKLPFNGLSNPHKCYKPVCFTSSPHTCLRALGTRPRLRLSSLRCGAPRWRRISPETPWTSCRATMPRRSAVPRSASLACQRWASPRRCKSCAFFFEVATGFCGRSWRNSRAAADDCRSRRPKCDLPPTSRFPASLRASCVGPGARTKRPSKRRPNTNK